MMSTEDQQVSVTITRSAGDDRAITVLIHTTFEPDGSDGPGLRVLVNDDEAYVGKAYVLGGDYKARSFTATLTLDQLAYLAEHVEHPTHVCCADACGLDVTHDGACLDKPGGHVVCTADEHEENT